MVSSEFTFLVAMVTAVQKWEINGDSSRLSGGYMARLARDIERLLQGYCKVMNY